MDINASLTRLGLGPSADQPTIRRAYARELKKIDQERDAAGFQHLRLAYEIALQRLDPKPANFAPSGNISSKADEGAQVLRTDPRQPVTTYAPLASERIAEPAMSYSYKVEPDQAVGADASRTTPGELAKAAFTHFSKLGQEMVEQGNARSATLWVTHLSNCLGDERLVGISARAGFETMVAQCLAAGWRPGHEGLFVAARKVFGWDSDRQRLHQIAQAGYLLNQAIDESAAFMQQQESDRLGQSAAAIRVRDRTTPNATEFRKHWPHLRKMATRFPAWTEVIVGTEQIKRWDELKPRVPLWRALIRAPGWWGGKTLNVPSPRIAVVALTVAFILFSCIGNISD